MNKAKQWWLQTGWPWLREYWWVLLILPVILLVFIARAAWSRGVVVVDPVVKADTRAKKEAEIRQQETAVERRRLLEELEDVKHKYERLKTEHEAGLEASVETLRNDPEKLKELMLKVGRDT